MKTSSKIIIVFVLLALPILWFSLGALDNKQTETTKDTIIEEITPLPANDSPKVNTTKPTAEQQLLYLIEEEKLAHDIYTLMYQKYGASIFGSILESETTHQARVLSLLQARSIADPRSDSLGVFVNPDLQQLFDDLLAKGNISITDAYEVGVLIEEKDIADISVQLSTTQDQDIIDTLEALRRGSENHLRAFNKQI